MSLYNFGLILVVVTAWQFKLQPANLEVQASNPAGCEVLGFLLLLS